MWSRCGRVWTSTPTCVNKGKQTDGGATSMYTDDDDNAEDENENLADPRHTTLEQRIGAWLRMYWKLKLTSDEKHDMEDEKENILHW